MKRIARSLLKGRRLPVVLGLTLTLLVAWLQVLPPDGIGSLIDRLDNLIYDQRYTLMPKPLVNPEHKIVVVDIDERSLQTEGQWPWNRFKLGQLVERLRTLEQELDADRYFAQAIANPLMSVVLAVSFNPVQAVEYGALPAPIVGLDAAIADRVTLQEMAGYTANIAVLQEAAAGAGIMNQLPDVDGIIRRVPLVARYGNQLYPTLALEMARLYYFE